MTPLQKTLFKMQDSGYRDFHSKLMPEIKKENVIGIRTPELRKFAKQFYSTAEAEKFVKNLPHRYYEENNLHAFLLEQIKDYNLLISELEKFLPYIDNWATCDMLRPKIFKNHLPELKAKCLEWINSDSTYTVRFGIVMLMTHFLDDEFDPDLLSRISRIKSDEYYVTMAVAWYFATALAKQYEHTLPYFENKVLCSATHRKAIQKARESYRITPEQKLHLKSLA